jgi:hypothetical protein
MRKHFSFSTSHRTLWSISSQIRITKIETSHLVRSFARMESKLSFSYSKPTSELTPTSPAVHIVRHRNDIDVCSPDLDPTLSTPISTFGFDDAEWRLQHALSHLDYRKTLRESFIPHNTIHLPQWHLCSTPAPELRNVSPLSAAREH